MAPNSGASDISKLDPERFGVGSSWVAWVFGPLSGASGLGVGAAASHFAGSVWAPGQRTMPHVQQSLVG